ncbi:MAG: hypothetical protein FJW66_02755 [Actinobacteria bacterium]|nr:hypothetical protein [Actinomycetota bacterium]
MRKIKWQLILGISLAVLSAALYSVHFLIFRDSRHIFIYLLGDVAFLPIEVLLVTLIIDRVLSVREKRAMLDKLNMVIGAFFSEVGLRLLYHFSSFDLNASNIKKELSGIDSWKDRDFDRVKLLVKKFKYSVSPRSGNLEALKGFLTNKRAFLLRLLENPNLLEHEKFTELLWAVFHLTEELEYRKGLDASPESDLNHIAGDIKRAYVILIGEWLEYIKHLKNSYPYLFSLASRINPFDENASPIVR